MSLRPTPGVPTPRPRAGRLQQVLEIGARNSTRRPYRLASTAPAIGKTVYVDVIIPQLGSSVVVVRDDISEEDRARLSEILNRVGRGESLSDDDLAFLYTLG